MLHCKIARGQRMCLNEMGHIKHVHVPLQLGKLRKLADNQENFS